MKRRFSVVLSQGQSLHPDRQTLEEQLLAQLSHDVPCDVLVVPHVYDLDAAGPSLAALRETRGDLIVLAWLYPRATHWILDRQGVRGRRGLTSWDEGEDETAEDGPSDPAASTDRVSAVRQLPDRTIYCLDLRRHEAAQPYLQAIQQIVQDGSYAAASAPAVSQREGSPTQAVRLIDEQVRRRWYPVIDFSHCTNCMECIDFCLFGVYGVDQAENILVELPDNCRKGCPACSRVCPENAILFPQHKTPAVAGAMREPGGLKMDLSALFGAADDMLNARDVATRERDEHLLIAGHRPVGPPAPVSAPRSSETPGAGRDKLDALIDQLDELDL